MNDKWRFGGIPTEIDVKKLSERYGTPPEGTLISHEDIAACIGHEWKTPRYRTVLDAWRRKLMKLEVDTSVEPGQGLYVLLPPERLDAGKKDSRSGLRKFRRGGGRVAATPDEGLTEAQRAERNHIAETIWRVSRSAASEMKGLEPPPPPKALPRRRG